jgi:hypothetical protein
MTKAFPKLILVKPILEPLAKQEERAQLQTEEDNEGTIVYMIMNIFLFPEFVSE